MKMLRRALVALGIAGAIAAVLRVRGIGRHAAPGGRLAGAVRRSALIAPMISTRDLDA